VISHYQTKMKDVLYYVLAAEKGSMQLLSVVIFICIALTARAAETVNNDTDQETASEVKSNGDSGGEAVVKVTGNYVSFELLLFFINVWNFCKFHYIDITHYNLSGTLHSNF
jgi:hypothetical protein